MEITASDRKSIEAQIATLPKKYQFAIPKVAYEAVRTPTCPTGIRGRLAVFEVMEMSADIERIILDNPVESRLWAAARGEGMLTMREDAIVKAFNKQIPFSEINSLSTLLLAEEEGIGSGKQDCFCQREIMIPLEVISAVADETKKKKERRRLFSLDPVKSRRRRTARALYFLTRSSAQCHQLSA